MRIINFRGLTRKGEWKYGYFWVAPDGTNYIKQGGEDFEVDTNTVGQFTGRKDKEVAMIFEGDIVRVGNDLIEEIKWVDENNWNDTKCPVNGWVNHQSIYKLPVLIIGNIYEHPHLLLTTKE